MPLYAYVFALVLGGTLLLASTVLGGDDADHDADAGDLDLDLDADVDVDADAGGHDHAGGDLGGFFGALVSLRFWTFFATFFGLTGAVLQGLDLAGPMETAGLSVGTGALTGYVTVHVLRRLSSNDTGVAAGVSDYIGKSGRVIVAVGHDGPGKVRLEMKGTTVDVLATTDDDAPIPTGEQALVVQMQGTQALVTRIDTTSDARA